MKQIYNHRSVTRAYKSGDKVLVLFPVTGQPLQAKYMGPYIVDKQISDVDYLIRTPDRRKSTQLCHVNMIKTYYSRDNSLPVALVDHVIVEEDDLGFVLENECKDFLSSVSTIMSSQLKNSDILSGGLL